MGACYSVVLRLKVKDENKAFQAVKQFIVNSSVRSSIEELRQEGVDTDTLDGLIRVVLAGWKCTQYRTKTESDGFVVYENDFNASYGWEGFLIDFFKVLEPFMEDTSSIYIEPDDDYDEAIVENGKINWIH